MPKSVTVVDHSRYDSQNASVPADPSSDHVNNGDHNTHVAEGGGDHLKCDAQKANISPVQLTIDEIRRLHRRQVFAQEQRKRADLATLAYLRFYVFGFARGRTKEENDLAKDRSVKLKTAVEKERDIPADIRAYLGDDIDGVIALIIAAARSRVAFDELEASCEKQMTKLVKTLPIYPWAKAIKGFGELSLARIVAETGDLCNYANPAKVWRRMGMAVLDGRRQGNPRHKTAEAWINEKYSPHRRSIMWNIERAIIKQQWTAPKEDQPGFPTGEYGVHYYHKKCQYLERVAATEDLPATIDGKWNEDKWTKARADAAAYRYMGKQLLKALWKAWKRVTGTLLATDREMSPGSMPQI